MTDFHIYAKLCSLPSALKAQVVDYIDFLAQKSTQNTERLSGRKAGMAKGLIKMKDNFDDPVEGFKDYLR